MVDTRECTHCKEGKSLENFHKDVTRKLGRRYVCKSCSSIMDTKYRERRLEYIRKFREDNPGLASEQRKRYAEANRAKLAAKTTKYRQTKRKAVPSWYDAEEVSYIYLLAEERNFQVDHIVPIQSKYVCGLHVQDNLRCIPMKLNKIKGNYYWPDMPGRMPSSLIQ